MVAVPKLSQKHRLGTRPSTGAGAHDRREKSRSRSGTLGKEGRHGLEPFAAWEEPEGVGVPGKVGSREKVP